jgi:hypothetical protein
MRVIDPFAQPLILHNAHVMRLSRSAGPGARRQTAQEMENGPVVFSFTLNIGRARPRCMGKLTGHRGFPRHMHWFQRDRTKS